MDIIKEVNKEFADFKEFVVQSEYGSAAVCLAKVHNAITHYKFRTSTREVLNELDSHFRSLNVQDIIDYLASIRERALQILSCSSTFDDGEIFIVLSIVIEEELIEGMLKSNGVEFANSNNRESIYESANECFSTKLNLSDYKSTKVYFKNDTRLPMKLSWMEVNKGYSSHWCPFPSVDK